MKLLDRYLIGAFVVNYIISLAVLVLLYVVLDLFFNFDEFTQDGQVPLAHALTAAAKYYGSHTFLYFSQISGVITMFAMLFTLARMQRSSEFVAIVASGVSLYRIAFTIIMTSIALSLLWLANQELIIPGLAPYLARTQADAATERAYGVWFLTDPSGALLSAAEYDPSTQSLSDVAVLVSKSQTELEVITADRATWIPPDEPRNPGRWELVRGRRLLSTVGEDEPRQESVSHFASVLGPDQIELRQATNWIQFLDRGQLADIRREQIASHQQIARTLHNRFATPFVNILILIIGIPFFLDRQPASVVHSAGKCLLACGGCFLFAFLAQNVDAQLLSPVLTAWLPLIVFTPLMVVRIDSMKT